MSGLIERIAATRRAKVKKMLYQKALRDITRNRRCFLSIRECCEILGVDMACVRLSTESIDDVFTCICAWDYYLIPGCLYAALPLYAKLSPESAIAFGAKALLTDKQESDYPCIIVDDVMAAYCKLCGYIREQNQLQRTVAVTGSVGKTTTKDMLKAVFKQTSKTFCDVENNNMATLVGYLVQHIPSDTETYIQEVHEGDPGSAKSISKIIQPDIAVVTNIGESHLGNFGSYEDLLKGVTDITAAMPENGIIIIDGDDGPSVDAPWDRRVIRVSAKNAEANYYAENTRMTNNGLIFDIVFSGGRFGVELHMYGAHNVTNALLAFAAGVESGISPEQAVQGLNSYKPKGMRQHVVKSGGRVLYIDCFNAAVKSMKTALDTLGELPLSVDGKRIAVLGDMAELGNDSEKMHREVGKLAADANIDELICYGPLSVFMAEEAKKAGKLQVYHTESMLELNKLVKEHVGANDAVLFKASHATNLIASVRANYPLAFFKIIYLDRIQRHFARTSGFK